jgi:hypothetical protein
VNDKDERVRVFMKKTDGVMDGLVVMVVGNERTGSDEVGEVVFINIVGEIDPANVNKVTDSLYIDIGS